MMDELPKTAGVERCLQRAATNAELRGVPHAEPIDLLVGLLTEESVAHEMLSQSGVSITSLQTTSPLAAYFGSMIADRPESLGPDDAMAPGDSNELPDQALIDLIADDLTDELFQVFHPDRVAKPTDKASVLSHPTSFLGVEVQAIVHRARGIAARQNIGEVSTEQLLHALVESSADVGEYLRSEGLTLESDVVFAEKVGPTIAIDLDLDREPTISSPTAFDPNIFRILDASANRAREGMRVVEDFVRFVWNDATLTRDLKELRHQLVDILRSLQFESWIRFRDTPADVGTGISTGSETDRADSFHVVSANLKRVTEALRTLEEFAKTLNQLGRGQVSNLDEAASFEQLRYRWYAIEKSILNQQHSSPIFEGRTLYLLLTVDACTLPLEPFLDGAIRGGVRIIQIREKQLDDRKLLEHARRVRRLTRDRDVLLIMNDRPDLAVLCDADGVHVGQDELSVQDARQILKPNQVIGVSTHSIDQANQAVQDGADYIGVGPVFPSPTKSFGEFAGLEFVSAVAREHSLPWFAIGGINEKNLVKVVESGASRIAVSHCLCSSTTPQQIAARLAEQLGSQPASG